MLNSLWVRVVLHNCIEDLSVGRYAWGFLAKETGAR